MCRRAFSCAALEDVGMRFSLRWLFEVTVYIAVLTVLLFGVGKSWPPEYWFAIAVALLIWGILSKVRDSGEAEGRMMVIKTRHRIFRDLLWLSAICLIVAAGLSISDGDWLGASLDLISSAIMFLLLWIGRLPATEKP
jgi:hypothetical protein